MKHRVRGKAASKTRATKRPLWLLDSPQALDESVDRATSALYPTHFEQIYQHVKNDYGSCCERTVYRAIRRAVESNRLVKLDKDVLGLSFSGYIKPGSRLLRDPMTLREQMLDWIGQGHVRNAPSLELQEAL